MYGYDQNIGSFERFCLGDVVYLWSLFFKIMYLKLTKGYFSHTGCLKNAKWTYFGAKIDMCGNDQNIGSPEKFCLCDVVNLWTLFQKWVD